MDKVGVVDAEAGYRSESGTEESREANGVYYTGGRMRPRQRQARVIESLA